MSLFTFFFIQFTVIVPCRLSLFFFFFFQAEDGIRDVAVTGFFFSSRRRHTRCSRDWSSDVCSSDLGPPSQRGRYRHRAEAEARVAAPDCVVTILEQLGYAVSVRIDRRVEVYRLGQAVLRLEWYPAMDVLLEVEGEPSEIEHAIAATGLARDRFLPESLPYFVAQFEARTGQAALLAR